MSGGKTVTTTVPCTYRIARIATPEQPFVTEHGDILPVVDIAYETWGTLSPTRDNVVLICHALTGSSHVASHAPDDQLGWWEPMVGPGRFIDTDRHFVICANVLGSCYGSTGPRSIDPRTGRRYNLRFPLITIRDIVRSQALLLDQLGIERIYAVIGGSLGGMQVLEWAAMYPDRVERIVPIAVGGQFSDQGIAYNEVQRRAIMLDPAWRNGEYEDGEGPQRGLAIARMLGVITYQSDELMTARFERRTEARYTAWPEFLGRYDVEGYLHYQGDKLVRRFDANCYLYLTRAMDSHDLGRGRGGYPAGLALIRARTLCIGIRSDILFWPSQVRQLADDLRAFGTDAQYWELDSPNGHDAFLKDFDQIGPVIAGFLAEP
ncbi:homoserine O-acetyltransferase [Thermomicrobium sp. 4228-Ro]|uniref:homoserine O-acetyltransferase MetX n=1 Tax=Thermomicrobium sp. 4228-Ro TaxID=2993937 RepID=UPI0022496F2D|nr:homoserine O-acetyltransferase [Thermomicrobium sp. 4228-Ro]MCX2726492.1 homoserine O-acetyltransferase [Thermomicrobium sp. 4228-Ro]